MKDQLSFKQKLSPKINDIAQSLEMSMNVFIHRETAEVLECPNDEYMDHMFMDEENPWQKNMERVGESDDDWIRFEKPSSREAFQFMESFAENMKDENFKVRLFDALNGKRPFANFKLRVDHSDHRQSWFKHRDECLEKYILQEIEYGMRNDYEEE